MINLLYIFILNLTLFDSRVKYTSRFLVLLIIYDPKGGGAYSPKSFGFFIQRNMKRTNFPKDTIVYNHLEDPITISMYLMETCLKEENPGELVALYMFYYYTAKWQKTNQPKATDGYCQKGLNWGYIKFKKAKDGLIKLNLIEKRYSHKKGRIDGWFIKVNFIWKQENKILEHENTSSSKNKNNEKLVLVNQCINALSKNNINALSKNTSSSPIKKITPSQFDSFWKSYPKKGNKGASLTAWNKLCKKPISDKNRPEWKIIKRALIQQKKSERWQNPKFIPLASTWLNQSRWLDDPAEMVSYEDRDTPKSKITIGHIGDPNHKHKEYDVIV